MAEIFSRVGVLFAGLGVLLLLLLGARSEIASQEAPPVPIAYAMVENPETLERRDFSMKTANFAYPEWGS